MQLINCKGSVFHPDTLRSILDAVKVPVFDVDINADLLHINGPLCGIFPSRRPVGTDFDPSILEKIVELQDSIEVVNVD